MKVKELLEILSTYNQEATIVFTGPWDLFAYQPHNEPRSIGEFHETVAVRLERVGAL